MEIVVTDLTRMADGFICVAGIEPVSGRRVRPVLLGRIPGAMAASRGGIFDIGRVLELGGARRSGRPPEVEDTAFNPLSTSVLRSLDGEAFFALLVQHAASAGIEAFGPELKPAGKGGFSIPVGRGGCSLAIIREPSPTAMELYVTPGGAVRARWPDGRNLSVTDLRLCEEDCITVDHRKVARLARALAESDHVYLNLGLSRLYAPPGQETGHWLQINNVHASAIPDWRLMP